MIKQQSKVNVTIMADDIPAICSALHEIIETLLEGTPKAHYYIDGESERGHWDYSTEEVCTDCYGTGIVATDEDDGEGHTMRGVGESKCICQVK